MPIKGIEIKGGLVIAPDELGDVTFGEIINEGIRRGEIRPPKVCTYGQGITDVTPKAWDSTFRSRWYLTVGEFGYKGVVNFVDRGDLPVINGFKRVEIERGSKPLVLGDSMPGTKMFRLRSIIYWDDK